MVLRIPDGQALSVGDVPAVQLVPMRRRHLPSVLSIEGQVYPRPWSLSLFLSELAMHMNRSYTVARVDGHVVGYSGLMMSSEDGHVTNIAVDPQWQGHKIGTMLLVDLARTACRLGARHLTLEVRVSNQTAQKLYRRFGFYPAGVRKNYYAETNEDALVMWVEDIDTTQYALRLKRIEEHVWRRRIDGE